ncbi:ABC transporter ATP-binding protein [Bifidobacterium adolescentis]|uniref:ABC transporter ATP-binding protein n=1 Tax=Bifidobacterium adolescentis TaxID=1680 RepID=UPI001EDD77D1|nr:ABC transporter ATP-binding protein [Bifidobacterium adolescentis]MCG4793236.1 energy-coupling factor transporter ATPase [Bifidobacterium adolescentis]
MITVRDLSWQYEPLVDGGKPVDSLKHVSFDIKSGSFVGVIGPTGAGKSTLCMALAGIIPNLADGTMTGLVEVNGMNTSRHSVSALSERIGYVQQDPEAQLFCASVEDEIAFPLENRGIAPDIIDKQIDVMLDLVGMTGYRKRVPTSLSGGQMQRVAIAAALAAEPDVLILDEPTAALDPEGKQEVFDVLERIRQTRSMTVIMAEQDTEHIAYWADQVLFMVNGELVRNGDASLFVREKGLLESSGVQVADDPLPQVKAVQQGKKHKKDKKNQPERSKDVVISLDHVSYQYERGGNASKALDDVTFDIERGSFIGLIGRNGSGKTTLAKHLNGLIRPTQGTVTVDGLDASKHSVGEMAAHVGFVFQNPDHQIFCSTAKEEIAFGPTALGLDGATVFKRVDEMLTLFDLHRYEDVSPATLGYGERRAVALSSVLAMRTPILVLDEPTAGLDHRLAARFLGTIEKLNQRGVTIVMISHDMRAVYRYCTHVLELEDGKVVQYGPIDRSEAAQKQSRIIRKPRKSNGPVSATHVLLKVTKHEEGRH